MSHMHIPDGVLPLWLVFLGWGLVGAILVLVVRRLRGGEPGRRLPLLGVMAAAMLVGMSTEIVPIAYHTNLSVLAGIVLGPALGFLAALIVNLMLALFGHGGITVAGLNTLIIATEIVLGFYLFRGVRWLLRGRRSGPSWAAATATFLALSMSTLLMIGVVALSNVSPSAYAEASTEGLSFRNPFEHGLIASGLVGDQHAQDAESEPVEVSAGSSGAGLTDVLTFAKLVLALGFLGWLLESALTGIVVGFVHRERPDLVEGRPYRVVSAATASPGADAAPSGADGSRGPGEAPSSERAG